MKNYKYTVFILIASIIVGFLFVTNLSGVKKISFFNMKSSEFKDASEERNRLLNDITFLKENNDELRTVINAYNSDENGELRLANDMKHQLETYTPLSGNSIVSGPGIVLTIEDADFNMSENTSHEIQRSIFHDLDLALVINELRNAGAEAIAMNSYRILDNTGVTCSWAFVTFNNEVMESAPFKFYAIGNPDYLEEVLFSEGSHLNKLIIRKLKVNVEKVDELVLPSAFTVEKPKYMERNEN